MFYTNIYIFYINILLYIDCIKKIKIKIVEEIIVYKFHVKK